VTRIIDDTLAFAPVGTRLHKAAATEDGGEGVLRKTAVVGLRPS